MLKKMKYLKLLPCIFLLFSCKSSVNIEYADIKLCNSPHLNGNVINDSFLFSMPRDIMMIDSLLIVFDSYSDKRNLHVFNKFSGEFLKSFAHKGRAAGETLEISSVNVDNDNIVVFDPNLRKIIKYDIRKILNDNLIFDEIKLPHSSDFVLQAIVSDTLVLLKGNSDKMRFGIFNESTSNIDVLATDYIRCVEDKEENWAIMGYGAKWDLQPDGFKMLHTTYIGAIVELFEYNGGEIINYCTIPIKKPIYRIADGAILKWIATTQETILGFEDTYVTNKFIYLLMYGVEKSKFEQTYPQILVFDWDGHFIKNYVFNERLTTISVDEDSSSLYGIVENENGYTLKKYDIANYN